MNRLKLLPFLLLILFACSTAKKTEKSYIAFTGATIIDGSGDAPIQNGVLLIQNGRVVAVGPKEKITIPENTTIQDVSGKTIIPGLINGHGHVGDVKGIQAGHYSKENILDNLAIYARYGITTVVSLGGDKKEAESFRVVNDTSFSKRARLYIAGEVISGNTPQEALAVLENNHKMGVDFMKIRVDDNLGTSPKMAEEVYQAVIKRSHELGYKIATHMYYLEDARKLLEAGTDMLAHSIRDVPVDESFIGLLKEKKVSYCATLTRELSTFVYEDTAAFFSDAFFLKEYNRETIQPLLDPAKQAQMRNSKSAQKNKQQLPIAMANLKTLSDQGIPIVFGTDSGMPARFMGYFEHLEMEMMAQAGLTPMQIILSATKNAAQYLGLKEVGTLSAFHWADFIILEADPLADIRNVRKMSQVYVAGEPVLSR
ncbi:amidohydrolase family protein [Rhodocytophaga rosea]|uniref:Amidohydrolase family protein n=1 Tax=Rhodocytophaga rosea TaxID=2704465 RepID=A0A6C0GS33_9BACT|nr:amidohydrolase family protein [Rhodocytophaga rosea]QHT70901.1 amidohydrolase family protein [Rhodocytophaga rosea]